MKGIYKRELKSYFYSMIGYVFIAFLVAFVGIYFMAYNLNMGYPYFSYTLSGGLFILLIAIPILTMKSFSESGAARRISSSSRPRSPWDRSCGENTWRWSQCSRCPI